ncbi:hypothetical protein [Streptomyces sp. NPDC048639]|uniref:hypothetical protein n=1 Tax=Streptomyces sp. NPDC048639 TaxID=3365581 RepID=UPI0037230621
MERIVRTDFRKVHGFSKADSLSLLPARVWSAAEWDRIRLGYRARGMDERWNVFAEGDRLFLHRSWTGHRIYEAVFAPAPDTGTDGPEGSGGAGGPGGPGGPGTSGGSANGGARIITGALVEGDPRRHRRTSDAYDAVMLEVLVSWVLLGERSDAGWQRLNELRRGERPAGGPGGAQGGEGHGGAPRDEHGEMPLHHDALGLRPAEHAPDPAR